MRLLIITLAAVATALGTSSSAATLRQAVAAVLDAHAEGIRRL